LLLCLVAWLLGWLVAWLVGWLLAWLIDFSRIARKSAGDNKAPVTDPPAARTVSSLQWLAVHVLRARERNVFSWCSVCECFVEYFNTVC
jgi:hypothetical protein